jgi:hypothetical protein
MIKIIAYNLPFLFVYLLGIWISLKRKPAHKQISTLALIAYGILMGIWGVRMIQLCWFLWGRSQGVDVFNTAKALQLFNISLSAVHYLSLMFLFVGAFLWRSENTKKYQQPGVIAIISAVLILIGVIMSQRMLSSKEMYDFIPLLFLVGDVGILIAFFGWREENLGEHVTFNEPPVALKRTVTDEVPQRTGMFEPEDFIPFIAGVIVFGGLGIIPLVWGHFSDISYAQSLLPSLISCGIFLYAHDKHGNFSLMRFIIGIVFLFMAMVRAAARSGSQTKPMFFAGGILGYVIMLACGWAGIYIARLIRRKR